MTLEIDGNVLEVIIERKKIKHIYIRVKNNKVYVSANNLVTINYIQNMLKKEEKSIRKMYLEQLENQISEVIYLGNKLDFHYNEEIKIRYL